MEKSGFLTYKLSVRVILDTYKGRGPSELVLLREGLPSEIALKGVSLESKTVYHFREVGTDFQKPNKIFSAHNEKRSMKRGEKWFPEKLRKILT